MRKWRSLSALMVLGPVVACATATNDGAPGAGDLDASSSGGNDVVGPSGGDNSVTAGSGTVAGSTSVGGGQLAFEGGSSMSGSSSTGGAAGGSSTGGVSGAAGAHSGGSSGTSSGGASGAGTGGVTGMSGAGGASAGAAGGTSTGPCANPKDVTGTSSGNLGAGDVCLRTMQTFNTVGCSEFTGRTLKVNGVAATCGVGATYTPIGGYNYLEVSAGGSDFASISWYCTLMSCG
jgi:hypothetical protein